MPAKYFEDVRRGKRWMGYSGAYSITDFQPFVDVWNRLMVRWNEVELDNTKPLTLHDFHFDGANIFGTATSDNSEIISHPDFLIQIFFRKQSNRWAHGLSCGRAPVSVADVRHIMCHYRVPDVRDAVWTWLDHERERFVNRRNSYDTVIAFLAARAQWESSAI